MVALVIKQGLVFVTECVFNAILLFDLYLQNITIARNQTVIFRPQKMFALNRLKKECYYEPIRVDFCPISKPNQQFESIVPMFNMDRHFFTPAFILPRQKITVEQNLNSEKSKFEARISHSQSSFDDKTPVYNPTDNSYCQLCQQEFEDYWDHINGKYHKRMINSSKFNRDIMALCETIKKANKTQLASKTKPIQKKKTCTRQITKLKNYKTDKQQISEPVKNKESLRTVESEVKNHVEESELGSEQKRRLQESLKITLNLNNHSTNLLNSNTFKEFCKNT